MARLARKQGSARLSESPIKLLLLEWLYWMCHPCTSGQSRFTQLVNIWYLNKWTVVGNLFGIATFVISAAGAPCSRYMQFNVRMAISLWSCLAGVLIQRKRRMLFSVIQLVADLGARAHRLTDRQGKDAMRKSAVVSRLHAKALFWYGGAILVTAAFNLLMERSIWAEVLVTAIGGPRMADSVWNTAAVCVDWATTIEYQYNTLLDGSAIFVSLACITTLTRSLAEIQTQINRGVKVGDCLRWAALQSRVTAGCRELEETFADLLPHILISAYFTPLLAIVDVVFNGRKADLFSLALSPVVLLVLWPMCDIGDELAKARERLCPAAYLGPWLEEGGEQTRVRLCLMLFAYGRHGLLRTRGPGGGVLNRGTFTTAISSWIKFLNALINLQSASRHQVRGK